MRGGASPFPFKAGGSGKREKRPPGQRSFRPAEERSRSRKKVRPVLGEKLLLRKAWRFLGRRIRRKLKREVHRV